LKDDDRLSEQAESPLGYMHLSGQLKVDLTQYEDSADAEARYQAGDLYAKLVGAYRSVIETPRGSGGSGLSAMIAAERVAIPDDTETPQRGFGCPSDFGEPIERSVRIGAHSLTVREWPCERDPDGCACARRKARYDNAFEALMAVGQRAAKVVARVVVHREAIAPQDRVYLVAGLEALARHFGLTERQRRRHSRNAS
jgi:hypothetical protein